MKRNNSWKWALVIFLVAWSLWELNPPTSRDLIEQFQSEATKPDATFQAIVKRAQELRKDNTANSYGAL